MVEPARPNELPHPARRAVGSAIQSLAAARLGRAFLPCGVLTLAGLISLARGNGLLALALAGGGLATSATMLAYVQATVRCAFGHPMRPWMSAAALGGVVPPSYGIYVVGWLGLKGLTAGAGEGALLVAILFAGVGVWLLRSWVGVVEVRRLSRVMMDDIQNNGGAG